MSDKTEYLGYWLRRFLSEYLVSVKNMSRNTLHSYRDSFRLLIAFATARLKLSPDKLLLASINQDVISIFLSDLEEKRNVSIATRNQRLAAFQSFAKYVAMQAPEHIEWCRMVRNIPMKKASKQLITYLEKSEMDGLLATPDIKTKQGWRDYVLLLFLYNTGARADEAASLSVSGLSLPQTKSDKTIPVVTIKGKGGKTRRCPLWKESADALYKLTKGKAADDPVFVNRVGQRITRFGIYEMVTRYAKQLEEIMPPIKKKRVSPHTIRHTTATHLLQAGVDINTIRVWLGHVSVNTTNVYAEVNLEMKAKALQTCNPTGCRTQKIDLNDENLLSFLESL